MNITHTNDGTFNGDGKDPIATLKRIPEGHWQEWEEAETNSGRGIHHPSVLAGNTEVTWLTRKSHRSEPERTKRREPSVTASGMPFFAANLTKSIPASWLRGDCPPKRNGICPQRSNRRARSAIRNDLTGRRITNQRISLVGIRTIRNWLIRLPKRNHDRACSICMECLGMVLDSIQPGTGHGMERVGLRDPLEQLGAFKVSKGGSFKVKFDQCRSAVRQGRPRSSKNSDTGFRVALGPILSDPNPQPFVEPKASYFKGVKTLSLVRISAGSFVMGSPGLPSSSQLRKSPKTNQLIYGSPSGQLKQTDWLGEKTAHFTTSTPAFFTSGSRKTESSQEDVRMELFHGKGIPKGSLRKWRGHAHEITALRRLQRNPHGFLGITASRMSSRKMAPNGGRKAWVAEHIEFSPDGMRILCFAPHNPTFMTSRPRGKL